MNRRIPPRNRIIAKTVDTYALRVAAFLKSKGIEPTTEAVDKFINWRLSQDWTQYNQSAMDRIQVVKTQIDALPLSLPNAKKGVAYTASISIPTDLVDWYRIVGLEGSGMKISEVTDGSCEISGSPEIANDYTLLLEYHVAGDESADFYTRELHLAVNPDPRDLWKNIPTDPAIDYFKTDEDCDYVKVEANDGTPRKDIVAASKRGRSHAHEGRPRDDDFKICHNVDNGWYVLAVADGAGSARYSRQGSKIAVETASKFCTDALASQGEFENVITAYHAQPDDTTRKPVADMIYRIVGTAAFRANRAIRDFQEQNNKDCTPKDFSTTLLLAICKKFDFGWFVASFWVGDGAMAIYNADTQYLKVLGEPDGGEYAGQTRFLTMDSIFANPTDIMKRLRFSIEDDFSALMLMSDGVSDAKFETDANLNRIEKWNELWADINSSVNLIDDNENSKEELLNWLDFWSPGNHDDRTIAILY